MYAKFRVIPITWTEIMIEKQGTHSVYIKASHWLTHWGWLTHMCIGNLAIIGSHNGLSPGQCQAIVRINAGILLIGPFGTNVSEISIEVHTFSMIEMHIKNVILKMAVICLSLGVLMMFSLPYMWLMTVFCFSSIHIRLMYDVYV